MVFSGSCPASVVGGDRAAE